MRNSPLLVVLAAALALGLGVLLVRSADDGPGADGSLLDDDLAQPEGVAERGEDRLLRARDPNEPRVIQLEPLAGRGTLPASVQVAEAGDWRRAEETGDVDLISLIDPHQGAAHQEVAEPGRDMRAEGPPAEPPPGAVGELAPSGPPVLIALDGDLILRLLDKALGGRVPLRFQSAAALEAYRMKRLPHPVPSVHVGAVDLVGHSAEMLGYRVVAADGALYFRQAKPGEIHGEVPR